MDADIPTTNLITPSGAVRASDLVTITTQQAHGLQVDNVVQISNVYDTSFNVTAQIASVPTATTFTYGQALADATSGNGTVELIIQGDVYTDTVLLPLVNSAYRTVQSRLLDAGSKTATGEAIVTLPVGATELSDTTNPQLPVDFLAPRELFERINTQPYFGPRMGQVDQLPSWPQQAFNVIFSWRDDSLFFVGSYNSLDVKIRYFKSVLNDLTDASSTILIRGGLDSVAYMGAFLAAKSRNSENANDFKTLGEEKITELLDMQAHARQYKPSRRMAYNRRSRTFSNFGNYGGTV